MGNDTAPTGNHALLTPEQADAARASSRRFSLRSLSTDDLAALQEELDTEWRLMQGDLAEGEFYAGDEQVTRNGIALFECQLDEVNREMARRMRAGAHRQERGNEPPLQDRFDAMRRADIIDALSTLGMELRKAGRQYVGLCPFHSERTPSFYAHPEKGVWYCWGCRKGGDLVGFVVERNGTNRVDALRLLETVVG